jgi:hypothetical protein
MGEETSERWKGQDLPSDAEFVCVLIMTVSVEPRYSYCRLCEDCSPPGDINHSFIIPIDVIDCQQYLETDRASHIQV